VKKIFTENAGLKVISVVLAVLLWAYVNYIDSSGSIPPGMGR